MIKVLVTGSRTYSNYGLMCHVLDTIHRMTGISMVVEGGAKGADRMAKTWAGHRGVPVDTVHAEWQKYGNGAGPIRNRQMLKKHPDVDVVLAFGKGRGGTDDMVARARKAGYLVEEYERET